MPQRHDRIEVGGADGGVESEENADAHADAEAQQQALRRDDGGLDRFLASAAELWVRGVDVDWTQTVPEYSHLMLTSIIKRIDNSVFQAVERALNGEDVQPVFLSNLENEGVGIAEFHDYEDQIDQEVKDHIQEMIDMIIAGDLAPSDYYGE